MRMENIDQSLDSNQNHCEPTVNLPKPGAVRYHSATLIPVGAKFEHIFIHPTLAFFFSSTLFLTCYDLMCSYI